MIKIAKTAGFCMGVKRAVELTLSASNKHKIGTVSTFGPLIHNPQILNLFYKKKISVLKNIPKESKDVIIIRAHGVSNIVKSKLRLTGCKLIDATCPRVAKVQSIIKNNANEGFRTIIVGDKEHPEVIGLVGHADTKSNVNVICSISEFKKLPFFKKAIVVSQTTQSIKFYDKIKKWVAKHTPWYRFFDTVCDSTKKRQAEAKLLANNVDIIIVVGSKQSGNTKRLKEVVQETGKPVLHVENQLELFSSNILSFSKNVGITAGASTPYYIIKKVKDTVKFIISK